MNKFILAGIVFFAACTAASISSAFDLKKTQSTDLIAQATPTQSAPVLKVAPTAKQDAGKDSVFKMPAQPVLNGAKSRSELDEIIRKALK